MAAKTKQTKTLAAAHPMTVEIGAEHYLLKPTLDAADGVEAAYGGVLDAMQLVAKQNRRAMAHVVLLAGGGKVKPSAVSELAASLFGLSVEERGVAAGEVNEYLAWMLNGFGPRDASDDAGDAEEKDQESGNA